MKGGDKLPFFELLVSRKSTFEEVLKQMSGMVNENSKRGRLWIEDQVISGAKLQETLDEYGISAGQVVYVEYATSANQWPTELNSSSRDKAKTTTPGSLDDARSHAKTNGLYNLGNSKTYSK